MSAVTTHVLDTALGRPAAGVAVSLARLTGDTVTPLGSATTDEDGRAASLLPAGEKIAAGVYRLRFGAGAYFEESDREAFYPSVEVQFRVVDPTEHYHVPLLLSPFGYSTYRGS